MSDQDPSSTTPKTSSGPVFGPPAPTNSPPPSSDPQWGQPTIGRPATGRQGSANWSSYQPPPKPRKTFAIPMSPLLVTLPLLAAVSLDIATHSSWASISGFLAIVLTASGILVAKHRAGTLTPTAITAAGVAVVAGFNLVLRSALVVASPTWLLVFTLLLSASADLSFRTATQQITSISTYVGDLFRLPSWIAFTISQPDGSPTPRSSWLPLVRGLALAALITTPVVVLLASGDQIFASLFPTFENVDSPFPHIYLIIMFFPISAALLLTATRSTSSSETPTTDASDNKQSFPIELLLVFVGLVSVLAVWCIVQLLVISDGDQIISRTEGLTRAEYAREGFFQLVAVAAIVVSVIAVSGRFFRRAIGQRHNWAKVGVVLLTIETAALTAVALSKLNLYISSYGLTSTRLAVAWFLMWLLGTLLILSKRVLLRTSLLPQLPYNPSKLMPAVQAFACGMLILFGLSNPDHFVASTNLSRDTSVVQLDQEYLLRLSSDATPAIVTNQDRFDTNTTAPHLSPISQYCSDKKTQVTEYGLLGWNYGVAQSRADAVQWCEAI